MNRAGPISMLYSDWQLFYRCFSGSVARLVIRDILAEDAGTYCCVASNDAGESDCSSQVTVRSKSAVKKYPAFFVFFLSSCCCLEGLSLLIQWERQLKLSEKAWYESLVGARKFTTTYRNRILQNAYSTLTILREQTFEGSFVCCKILNFLCKVQKKKSVRRQWYLKL